MIHIGVHNDVGEVHFSFTDSRKTCLQTSLKFSDDGTLETGSTTKLIGAETPPSSDHHEPNSVALSGLNTHISMKLFVSSCIVNGLLRKVSCNFGKEKEHLMLEKSTKIKIERSDKASPNNTLNVKPAQKHIKLFSDFSDSQRSVCEINEK
nr:RecName: Full=Uncharacterized protein C30G12.3 [Caenorhabditis elegans]